MTSALFDHKQAIQRFLEEMENPMPHDLTSLNLEAAREEDRLLRLYEENIPAREPETCCCE